LHDSLITIAHHIPPELRQGLEILLSQSAAPQVAVQRLESFCTRHPSEFQQVLFTQFGLQSLISVFSSSDFLSEELGQHPGWLLETLRSGLLHRSRSSEEVLQELEEWLGSEHQAASPLRLAEFRRKQILRILLRDVLGFGALPEIVEELSNLADALMHSTYRRIKEELCGKYGTPRLPDGSPCGFSVVALGKLGGRELNYSSDIDLMFVFEGHGETDGAARISNNEFYKKVANQMTLVLGTYTAEGLIYRIDLRLRPDGRLGEVCISLDGARSYYESRARDWELQMLIKARVAAGEREPGRALLEWVQPKIYSTSTDFTSIESMSETRERINEKMNAEFVDAAGAGAAARQGSAVGFGVLAADFGIPVLAASGASSAICRRPADAHATGTAGGSGAGSTADAAGFIGGAGYARVDVAGAECPLGTGPGDL
jgi:glutamate-ammonia-ligase adenylyltransferase